MGSWAELPLDLLKIIAERILDHKDLLQFGAVCVQWRSILLANRQYLPYSLPLSCCLPPRRPLPLLMLFEYENSTGKISFLSISDRKFYKGFLVPQMSHKWISGSFEGWLVTVDTHGWQIHLLNPLTKAQMTLPPLSVFEHPKGSFEDEPHDFGFLDRAIILPQSNRTCFGEDCVVVGIVSCISVLSLCRPGDDKWTNIKGSPIHIDDVIPYKGQAYAITTYGTVVACDVTRDLKFSVIAGRTYDFGKRYLVESVSGDLLQVVRIAEEEESGGDLTDEFVVYRLEAIPVKHEKPICVYSTADKEFFHQSEFLYEWVELDSLGDEMLFLGRNCSMALQAASYPGCKGNCIYFADDHARHRRLARETVYGNPQEMSDEDRRRFPRCFGNYDIGVFDMETESIFRYEEMKGKCFPIPPVWITPNPW